MAILWPHLVVALLLDGAVLLEGQDAVSHQAAAGSAGAVLHVRQAVHVEPHVALQGAAAAGAGFNRQK